MHAIWGDAVADALENIPDSVKQRHSDSIAAGIGHVLVHASGALGDNRGFSGQNRRAGAKLRDQNKRARATRTRAYAAGHGNDRGHIATVKDPQLEAASIATSATATTGVRPSSLSMAAVDDAINAVQPPAPPLIPPAVDQGAVGLVQLDAYRFLHAPYIDEAKAAALAAFPAAIARACEPATQEESTSLARAHAALAAEWARPGHDAHGLGDEFTFNEVRGCMRSLKNLKAAGGDGIPAEFLKYSGGTGVQVLAHLFNAVLSTSCVPSAWRQGIVVHLAKGGDGGDCSNYATHTSPDYRQAVRQAALGADLTCGMPARPAVCVPAWQRHTQSVTQPAGSRAATDSG